jgi:hypothetical protein
MFAQRMRSMHPECGLFILAIGSGYLFNIQFLRRVFNPTFTLHDLRQTGPNDITTRWTMRMEFALTRCLCMCLPCRP